MPKGGENSKAVQAKARKADALKDKQEKKQKEVEDASWEDNDKHLAKKSAKKADDERRRLEKIQRKNDSKALEESEKESIALAVSKTPAVQKMTQAQIEAERERREAAAKKAKNTPSTPKPAPLVENLNRPILEEASTVDEALKMLTVTEGGTEGGDAAAAGSVDKHPERRMKAAYSAFEEARLPILKSENPSLRLSQLKQLIFEEWKKSPENPLNREQLAYNSK